MTLRRSLPALLLLATAPAACSSSPDIVARKIPEVDAGPLLHSPPPDPAGCNPGLYKGHFKSQTLPDGGRPFPLEGDFSFELQKSPRGEFFEIADNSVLSGTAGNIAFSGKISGSHACVEGEFSSTIEDGSFTFMVGQDIGFYGKVHGYYNTPPEPTLPPVFSGDWFVYQTASKAFLSGGTWSAYLITPE